MNFAYAAARRKNQPAESAFALRSQCKSATRSESTRLREGFVLGLVRNRMPVNLLQHRFVEFLPIVEVIQVDGIARGGRIVWDAAGAENGFSRSVIMDITADGGIEFF